MAEPRGRRRAHVYRVLDNSKVLAGSYPRLLFRQDRFVAGVARCVYPSWHANSLLSNRHNEKPCRQSDARRKGPWRNNHVSADVCRVLITSMRWPPHISGCCTNTIAAKFARCVEPPWLADSL